MVFVVAVASSSHTAGLSVQPLSTKSAVGRFLCKKASHHRALSAEVQARTFRGQIPPEPPPHGTTTGTNPPAMVGFGFRSDLGSSDVSDLGSRRRQLSVGGRCGFCSPVIDVEWVSGSTPARGSTPNPMEGLGFSHQSPGFHAASGYFPSWRFERR